MEVLRGIVDMVGSILTQVGVDKTSLYQMAVVIIVFVMAKFLFLNKLQEVLETRQEKTVKLESQADDVFEKIEEMEAVYNKKLVEAKNKAFQSFSEAKHKIVKEKEAIIKEKENELDAKIESERQAMLADVSSKKSGLLSEVDGLAQELVNKVVRS
ncbi:MAG: hypothetical protein H6620_12135 [Halobacteriovoraceae bacterium]|nr:hypothetical protein [Halobacteriovoraceae bacterium]